MVCFRPGAISERTNRAVTGGKRGEVDMSNLETHAPKKYAQGIGERSIQRNLIQYTSFGLYEIRRKTDTLDFRWSIADSLLRPRESECRLFEQE